MSFPSPDSSTHSKNGRKRKKTKEKSHKENSKRKFEPSRNQDGLESVDAIQNQAVHSTQDVEGRHHANEDVLEDLEKQLAELKRQTKNGIKLLKRYEKKKDVDPSKVSSLLKGMKQKANSGPPSPNNKPLTELLADQRLLHKELFKIICKKDFKQMLPKILKQYDVREVRKLCLNELETMTQEELLAAIENRQPDLPSTSMEESSLEKGKQIQENDTPGKDIDDKGKDTKDCHDIKEKGIDTEDHDAKFCIDGQNMINAVEQIFQKEKEGADIVASLQQVEENKNDTEVFEEIMKIPDQLEIDELIEEESHFTVESQSGPTQNKTNTSQNGDDGLEGNAQHAVDAKETVCSKSLAILELELRARALKSFIEAQEKKKEQAQENNNKT